MSAKVTIDNCGDCGKKPAEGETFFGIIDLTSDWWLTLLSGPFYCGDCTERRKKARLGAQRKEGA